MRPITLCLWSLVGWLLILFAGVGLVALCSRVAGGPHAWKVGLALALSPLLGFAFRERR